MLVTHYGLIATVMTAALQRSWPSQSIRSVALAYVLGVADLDI